MSRNFLTDPRLAMQTWPGLAGMIAAHVDANKPRPWDRQSLDQILNKHGKTVSIGEGVWYVMDETGAAHRTANYLPHEDAVAQAYASALDWLQQEVATEDELRRAIRKRNLEVLRAGM